MTIYYAVVEGDPLTSGKGSCVVEGVPMSSIQGPDGCRRHQTLLGQKAWCAACKSLGEIIAAPGSPTHLRERFDLDGYQALEAFGGDLVLCKCEKLPQIVSTYGRSVTANDYVPGLSTSSSSSSDGAAMGAATRAFNDRFHLIDDEIGKPLAHCEYVIRRADGQSEYGVTDALGYTHLLSNTHDAEGIRIELGNWENSNEQ